LRRDALLSFDILSRIPAGAVVNSAELRLRQTTAISESANLIISQITEAWSEDAVTYNTRPSAVDWDTGWAPDTGANIVITRDLTALVDFWVRYPDSFPDYGILLHHPVWRSAHLWQPRERGATRVGGQLHAACHPSVLGR
jgi:hypothetical protein